MNEIQVISIQVQVMRYCSHHRRTRVKEARKIGHMPSVMVRYLFKVTTLFFESVNN